MSTQASFDQDGIATESPPTWDDFESVRRLDWRFLLPDPALRRVIYWGPEPDPLLAALRRFCDSILVVAPRTDLTRRRQLFDLAVIRSADAEPIRRIHGLLAPGAFVYWEPFARPCANTRGLAGRMQFRSLPSARTLERCLRSIGFETISINWHYPDIETARFVIRLGDHAATTQLIAGRAYWAPPGVHRAMARSLEVLLGAFPREGMSTVVAQRSRDPVGGR
jgi:hypothetical protein